ncbi:MAG: hypothetical protein Q7K42_00005, partial [Candidatus Diapherotrites archaeon]|nr:hypothetical protein [Candidatus Diapherotrites archaeon]
KEIKRQSNAIFIKRSGRLPEGKKEKRKGILPSVEDMENNIFPRRINEIWESAKEKGMTPEQWKQIRERVQRQVFRALPITPQIPENELDDYVVKRHMVILDSLKGAVSSFKKQQIRKSGK